jgi:hypothetical protein
VVIFCRLFLAFSTEKFPKQNVETEQHGKKMLNKIRGCTFFAVAFELFCIFGKTHSIHQELIDANANMGDGGDDMCQCGPRCAGYVEEHICAR